MIVTSTKQLSELHKAFSSSMRYHRLDNEELNYLVSQGYCTKKPGHAKGSSAYHITMNGVNKLIELGELTDKEIMSIF